MRANPRIVLAKPGLDGHDRGIHVVARVLREAGFEVVMTGLRSSPAMIVRSAVDEDADVIGISVLSGAHNELAEEILQCLREQRVEIPLVVGGTIGPSDRDALLARGVAAVFPVGTSRHDIAVGVREVAQRHEREGRSEAASSGG